MSLTPSEIYMAAAHTSHLARCADCRDTNAGVNARAADNAASIARRDRRQLGLRIARTA